MTAKPTANAMYVCFSFAGVARADGGVFAARSTLMAASFCATMVAAASDFDGTLGAAAALITGVGLVGIGAATKLADAGAVFLAVSVTDPATGAGAGCGAGAVVCSAAGGTAGDCVGDGVIVVMGISAIAGLTLRPAGSLARPK